MNKMTDNHRRKRSTNDDDDEEEDNFDIFEMLSNDPEDFMKKVIDPSFKMTTKQYCRIVNKLKFDCMHENILDMWSSSQPRNITQNDIIEKLEMTKINQVTGHETNFTAVLGGVVRDASSGRIISARSLLTNFYLHLNFSEINLDRVGNAAGTEDWCRSLILIQNE